MKYYKLRRSSGESMLAVEIESGILTDLTYINQQIADFADIAMVADIARLDIDDVTRDLLGRGLKKRDYDLAEILEHSLEGTGDLSLSRPLDPSEVWAAGVTYKSSEVERRRESNVPDVYSKVYSSDRPEIFFKATSGRCMGPFESVGIRGDSRWNVPEPELAFVIFKGEIVGYTIGNDMSSRSIEGENPLYVSQAKVFDKCCAIGPCIVTHEAIGDPHNLGISISIMRAGVQVFSGKTTTAKMARRCETLADWLQRHNSVPDMTTVLTGTALVPPPSFTLHEGDVVNITIDNIGILQNDVVVV